MDGLVERLLINYSHIFFVFPADYKVAVKAAIGKGSFENEASKGG